MDSLDNIVTAVSEILLVFEEAQKDFLTDLKVETKNLEHLIHSIGQMVEDNKKLIPQIDDEKLREQMSQTFTDTINAANNLESLIKNQPNGIIARSAYKKMHYELAVILHNMVLQIQITDQCNVKILMTCAKKNLDCISRINKADSPAGVDAVARDLNKLSDSLHNYLKTRIAETTQPDISQRLSNSSESVKAGVPVATSSCKQSMEHPSGDTTSKKDKALRTLVLDLQEVVNAVLASAEYINNFALQFAMPAPLPKSDDKQPRVGQALTRLETAVKKRDPKESNAALHNLDGEIAKQAEEGRLLAKKMPDETAKRNLLNDAKELEELFPKISTATKNVLTNPSDANQREFEKLVNQARAVNDRIDHAKKPEQHFLENSKLLAAAMKRMKDAADRGDKDGALKAAKEVQELIAKQVAYARAMADQMKDPKNKKILLDAAEELERLSPLLVQSLKEHLADPNNKDKKKKFDDLMGKVNEENEKITKAILEDQLTQNNANLKNKIDELYDAVAAGDSNKANELLKDIDDLVNRRIELGKELVKHTNDPKLINQINSAVELLEKDLPELHAATNNALKNPSDAKSMQRLYQVGEEIKDAADRVTTNRKFEDRLPEQILANGKNLMHSLDLLQDAVRRGDAKAAAAAARDVANQIAKQVAFGRRLAEECDDPVLKKKILDACDDLESLSPKIVAETKNALMNPDDKDAQNRLAKLLDQARADNKVIMDAAEIIRANRNKPKPRPNISEPKFVDKVDPKDAIMVAASNVSKVSREQKGVTPEHQELIDLANAIGKEMEKLSSSATQNNKKDMITISRNIAEMVQRIQGLSTSIANKCTDVKLKERLLSLCRVPKNFAVQLKIISAVKATSGDNDRTAEAQLIACAQGVSQSVVQVITAAGGAAIASR